VTYHLVPLPDGRRLEVLDEGSGDRAFAFFWGTPGAAVPDPDFAELAARHRLRVLQPNRPGYGQSDPHPGRRVVDLVADMDAALQHLGISELVVMGGSGGGPHALAMAARLPQCRAAAALVSPAPRDADGLDYYDGMAVSNQEEWLLADAGEAVVRPFLEQATTAMLDPSSGSMYENDGQYADCVCPQDLAALRAAEPELRSARFAKAAERGIEGWLEDDLALTTPWGFSLDEIDKPVSFWAGREDLFVSYRHTLWMGQRVRSADIHVLADEGHLSVKQHHLDRMVQDLLDKAGWVEHR
jgi:pimeloyl-ACP methyl ester carboxylesterase